MKRRFRFSLRGGQLLPLYMVFWALFISSYGGLFWSVAGMTKRPETSPRHALAFFACMAIVFFVYCVFTVLFSRKIVPAFSLDGESFGFALPLPRFVWMNVAGLLLSGVTLGVYGPWYLAKAIRFYVGGIDYKGTRLEFRGRGGRLFLILLLTLLPPAGVAALLSLTLFGPPAEKAHHQAIQQAIATVLLVPYYYMTYKWMVDIRHGERTIRWATRFAEAVPRLFLQAILVVVTLGIYYPAAVLKLTRYFAERTVVETGGARTGVLGFDGPVGGGFLLIWGQALLVVVTGGIYAPWALCKVWSWMCEHAYLE